MSLRAAMLRRSSLLKSLTLRCYCFRYATQQTLKPLYQMNEMNLETIKVTLRKWAARKEYISRVWIFGSRATGRFRDDSDIDIAIEINTSCLALEKTPYGLWFENRTKFLRELRRFIPYKIQLVYYDEKLNDLNVKYVSDS